MDIIRALHDEKLFRPCFRDLSTWRSWETLLKALFGLEMDDQDLALYRDATGREKPPEKPMRELWAVVGRRGGKSFMSAIVAVYLALFHDYRQYMAPGERATILIVAADRSQAQTILNYIKGILHTHDVFSQYIDGELRESVSLTNGVDITVMSCSFRSVRGRTVPVAIFDETAFWRTVDSALPDHEILAATRPALATIPNSMLLVISSPYARYGILYETFNKFYGVEDDEVLAWRSSTRAMNPTITESFIERERAKDPTSARSEYDGFFREDLEQFLTVETVNGMCTLQEQGPQRYRNYRAFCDPSGGRRDSFTLAVGHFNRKTDRYVCDCLRAWAPPFRPDAVVADIAEILHQYRVTHVTGDRYAGAWVQEAFRSVGIGYMVADKAKSDLFLNFEGYANTGQVSLPNDETLQNELLALERRRGKSGKDKVDHPPRGYDDRANAVAGLVYILVGASQSYFGDLNFL